MKKNNRQTIIEIITLTTAITALALAYQANKTAARAVEVAEESNAIAFSSTNPKITVEESIPRAFIRYTGCRSEQYPNYFVQIDIYFGVLITNSGGNSVSLVSVELLGLDLSDLPSRYHYQPDTVYFTTEISESETNENSLPMDFPAGRSRYYHLGAKTTIGSTSEKILDEVRSRLQYTLSITWAFEFGDGNQATLEALAVPGMHPTGFVSC